jgi:NADP-dependent 3-hydroxy acid dehydrogenase YdfG
MSENKSKVVVITGASSGIGEATARVLAGRGAKVVLGARRIDRIEKIVADITHDGGQAFACALDVTNRMSMQAFIDAAIEEYGHVDVLVNNAGVMQMGPLSDLKEDEWNQMIDVNVKGVLNGIAAVYPGMRRRKSGHIINVSSVAGQIVFAGAAVYCATKFAVRAISEGFRQESGPDIRTTIISPGAVATELPGHLTNAEAASGMSPLYEIAIAAQDIASAIAFAIDQPANVDINEMLIRPTAQQV